MRPEERLEDHLLERDLEEILGGDAPPSIADRVLARIGPDGTAAPRPTRRFPARWVAAAGFLIATVSAVGLLSLRTPPEPTSDQAVATETPPPGEPHAESSPAGSLPEEAQDPPPAPIGQAQRGGSSDGPPSRGGASEPIRDAAEIDRLDPRLTSIALRGVTDGQIDLLLERLDRLSRLTLVDCPTLSDRSLEALSAMATLRQLRLHNCPRLSAGAIERLRTIHPGLEIERIAPREE